MAELNTGKLTQIIGAVLDVRFSEGKLPEINDAIKVPLKDGEELVVEVAQHLGDDTVRCIAMGPTDGLVRGMEAIATGGPISVPVGEKTLGRMFNVLGNPIEKHLLVRSSQHRQKSLRQESKSLTFSAHIRKVEKSVFSVVQELVRLYLYRSLSQISLRSMVDIQYSQV